MNLRSGEYIYIYHLQHRTNLTKRNTIIFSRLKNGIKKKKWKMIRDRQTKKRVLRRGEQLHFDLSEKSTHTKKKTFRAPHAAKQLNNLVSCVPCTEPANNNKSRVISTYFCYFYENQLAVFLFAWSLFCFFGPVVRTNIWVLHWITLYTCTMEGGGNQQKIKCQTAKDTVRPPLVRISRCMPCFCYFLISSLPHKHFKNII